VLGLPIPEVTLERVGASAVILSEQEGINPTYTGIDKVLATYKSDIRIFSKPSARVYRRMGVVLTYDHTGADVDAVKNKAIELSKLVKVKVD
jgi:phosphoribosylglycinamide formyltransferase 2